MFLYHYTCLEHLQQILAENCIKTSPSNLLRPKNPRMVNGSLVDITDSYKPVVWFTSLLDFEKASQAGLSGSNVDKTEAAICVNLLDAKKWTIWAKNNNIEKSWFNALKESAPLWDSFYIVEHNIPIDKNTKIIFRPDIMEEFNKQKEAET